VPVKISLFRASTAWVLACLGLALTTFAGPSAGKSRPVPAVFRSGLPGSVEDLKVIERHVKELITRVSPSVVAVRVGDGAGSGVVITEDGYVLCAAHVCREPDRPVSFTFPDGRTARGKTLGTNHGADSGLMKITDEGPWPHAELASPSGIRPGQWVLALGHPGGFDPERPVVARLGRILRTGGLLQTDCTLIGGDSGGPLFDMQGYVVGIHSRISESTTENFHVPIGTYFETWDRLAAGESWGRPSIAAMATIGVVGVDAPEGCRLESVREDGPADKAGLAPGDVILKVQGETITDAECLAHCVHQATPGDELAITLNRDGQVLSIRVRAEARSGWGRRGGPRR
jgi:serine protease Do